VGRSVIRGRTSAKLGSATMSLKLTDSLRLYELADY
jgi:hypothetical protein